jgi:hypothetical protein
VFAFENGSQKKLSKFISGEHNTRCMRRKVIGVLASVPLGAIIIIIIFINVRLYDHPVVDDSETADPDLLRELRWLKAQMNSNAADQMQAQYPEGYVFMNALYGLAWCNLIDKKTNANIITEGHDEAARALKNIDSSKGIAIFEPDLPIPYGAFYAGWRNYLAGRMFLVDSTPLDSVAVQKYKDNCDSIASVLKRDVYPVSYYNGAWPADVVLCVAALAAHDRIFEPKYQALIEVWLRQVKSRLDSKGMLPHSVHSVTKEITEDARGSSMSLMLVFLSEIDPAMAREQWILYKKHFVDTVFGMTGIREYPKGTTGYGDIDSGPLLFDLGSAATIVGMPAAFTAQDTTLSIAIRSEIEAFGFPTGRGHKRYVFGTLPIADAFIAWGHSFAQVNTVSGSFVLFHLCCSVPVLVIVYLFWLIWRERRLSAGMVIPWEP